MSDYGITFVDDDALMEGQDFALVVTPTGGHIFYRESALSPRSLEDSWTAYRELLEHVGGDPGEGAQTGDGDGPVTYHPSAVEAWVEHEQRHIDKARHLRAVI